MPKTIIIRDLSDDDQEMLEKLKRASKHNTYSKCLLEAGYDAIQYKKSYEYSEKQLRSLEYNYNRLKKLLSDKISIDKEIAELITKQLPD